MGLKRVLSSQKVLPSDTSAPARIQQDDAYSGFLPLNIPKTSAISKPLTKSIASLTLIKYNVSRDIASNY